MDNVKIFIDGIEKEVFGLFYIYNSKYYFIYTERELDENGYVILYMTQVGKETANTQTGVVETGYMIGVEVTDSEEQKNVQMSVSYIVEDKKNGTTNPAIQYLPINMLTNLKILSKKRFRLLKTIMVDNFKLSFANDSLEKEEPQNVLETLQPVENTTVINEQSIAQPLNQISNIEVQEPEINNEINSEINNTNEETVIIDYRARFFEEQEKNTALQLQIDDLTQKLNDIKKIIE